MPIQAACLVFVRLKRVSRATLLRRRAATSGRVIAWANEKNCRLIGQILLSDHVARLRLVTINTHVSGIGSERNA
jgi:hypothetical protein